ncbi:DNA methyltransferase [Aeromonas sobria]|uniref:DNA methyltransferase n=1 Tax=Aeromonas sobria TaxID=646 RepID=UPI001CA32116|nr:DNA methyltransferase [Aeromonas sobria]
MSNLQMSYAIQKKGGTELNRLYEEDKSIHDWYRFVLSYPPHLVRDYIKKFDLDSNACILDPFAGTGTTLVEAKKLGLKSVGIEANPVVQMAASTKITWDVNTSGLLSNAEKIISIASDKLEEYGSSYLSLTTDQEKLIITNSISEKPLHKVLVLLNTIQEHADDNFKNHFKSALAKQSVFSFSNLHFGPEVGVKRKKLDDAPVLDLWFSQIEQMAFDIEMHYDNRFIQSKVHLGDARDIESILEPNSIDAIITSPPYPNEKDYTRTTRLESVLLGFMQNKADLRFAKNKLLRSNTRNVYKGDDDSTWVESNQRIQLLAESIENKRIELGKTSGFEKLYHKVVRLYFGGMAKHLHSLKPKLKPGAKLAYVVGDQASFFRTPIRTGEILADVASGLGYEVLGIDLFRTRLSTVTKEQLREEVVLLRWNG